MDGDRLLRNSDHAFDSSHHATNDRTDRTGRALADRDALLASTDNALRLRGERCRKSGNDDDGSHHELRLHEQTPLPMFCGFDGPTPPI